MLPHTPPGQLAGWGREEAAGQRAPSRQTPTQRQDPGAGRSPVPPALRSGGERRFPPSDPALVCGLLFFSPSSGLRVVARRARL